MNRAHGAAAAAGIVLAVGWLLATSAFAGEIDSRLKARLDPPTARKVQAEVDRARAEGLPAEPLVLKALEGVAKGAPAGKIVSAVRRNAAAMGDASRALGPSTTEAELIAGAGAILAGAPPDSLRTLRATRGDSSLVIPLVVISDLLARRVPAREATGLVVESWRDGISGTALLRMREWIHHDIQDGVAPSRAALRARAASERMGVSWWSLDASRPPESSQPPRLAK